MKGSFKGRLRNLDLRPKDCLIPVFEAISNSIQSIEESDKHNGKIKVKILREASLLPVDAHGNTEAPIIGFEISDNGIGFNDENLDSFSTLDSLKKDAIGGKGVGRLTWLLAFEYAKVKSTFIEDGKFYTREFYFHPTEEGVNGDTCSLATISEKETTITLFGFKPKFRDCAPKNIETFAKKIIDHFPKTFLAPTNKIQFLLEEEVGGSIELNKFFTENYLLRSSDESYKVDGYEFNLLTIKTKRKMTERIGAVSLCAHSRAVVEENLTEYIPSIEAGLCDENGEEFWVYSYISGDYLDANVGASRIEFNIPRSGELGTDSNEITINKIVDGAVDKLLLKLDDAISRVKSQNYSNARSLVDGNDPKYGIIIEKYKEKVEAIPSSFSPEKVEIELHKILMQHKQAVYEKVRKISNPEISTSINSEEFRDSCRETLQSVDELCKADLVEYVMKRKMVLEYANKLLERDTEGNYSYEEELHSIFFPRFQNSGSIEFEDHNLWIIDEKLAYHGYIASDIELSNESMPIESDSQGQPDIVVFDKALAFKTDSRHDRTVVIVEFKRPENFSISKNPLDQIIGYIKEIKSGRIKDHKGKTFQYRDDLKFHCYIVFTFNAQTEQFLKDRGFSKTFDGANYFWYCEPHKAYFEAWNYETLFDDASIRNQAFFDKLNAFVRRKS